MPELVHAVLFDLDNTLILFDENQFYNIYSSRIGQYFNDLFEFSVFQNRLISSTMAMIDNNGKLTNADFFMSHFMPEVELRETCWERFMLFYEKEFDGFQNLARPVPGVQEMIKVLRAMRIHIIIASNPVWPLLVQKKRLAWAGIRDEDVDFITHIENMSFCKPRLEYYDQICKFVGLSPKQCIMVGNDPYNDVVPKLLGMKTFLTLDSEDQDGFNLKMSQKLRNHKKDADLLPDFKGKLADVLSTIESLSS